MSVAGIELTASYIIMRLNSSGHFDIPTYGCLFSDHTCYNHCLHRCFPRDFSQIFVQPLRNWFQIYMSFLWELWLVISGMTRWRVLWFVVVLAAVYQCQSERTKRDDDSSGKLLLFYHYVLCVPWSNEWPKEKVKNWQTGYILYLASCHTFRHCSDLLFASWPVVVLLCIGVANFGELWASPNILTTTCSRYAGILLQNISDKHHKLSAESIMSKVEIFFYVFRFCHLSNDFVKVFLF